MSTITLTLQSQSIADLALSLKAEFLKAKLMGFKATATSGTVQIEMPLARLAAARFVCDQDLCSWTTANRKIVLDVRGFAIKQRAAKNVFYVVFKQNSSRFRPGPIAKEDDAVREIFVKRSMRAIEDLKSLDERKLVEAVKAPTDYSVLVSALNTDEALASIRGHDPLAGARLRGLEAKRQLIEADGEPLSSTESARLLRVSRQAIDKRRKEGKLLGLKLGKKGYHYPSWQFGLEGLEEVLTSLRDRDAWEQVSFFVNPSSALDDRTPVEVLRSGRKENITAVVNAAATYGEQGG